MHWHAVSQLTYDVIITPLPHQNDVATSSWCYNHVIITSCVCWFSITLEIIYTSLGCVHALNFCQGLGLNSWLVSEYDAHHVGACPVTHTRLLTLLLLRSEYSEKTRPMPSLLMPCCRVPLCYQQPWYWLCNKKESALSWHVTKFVIRYMFNHIITNPSHRN